MPKNNRVKTSQLRKKIVLSENPVESFLKNNTGRIYSRKTLATKLNISKSYLWFLISNSNHIRTAHPTEIGSGKHYQSIYTYSNEE